MEQFVTNFDVFVKSTGGQVILALIATFILMVSVGFAAKQRYNTKILVYSAMAIALATVSSVLKVYQMPMGGSVTLFSMLFVAIIGYWFGPVQGILCGLTYGLLQLIIDPVVIHPVQLILDYFLAFSMLGLSGSFRGRRYGLIMGYLVAVLGRFIISFISGFVFFGEYAADWGYNSEVLYSLVYNISYIGTEAGITVALLCIPSVREAFDRVKRNALV